MQKLKINVNNLRNEDSNLLKSMTGYGRGESLGENYSVTLEMKSVNHRFLEISIRLPKQLNPLEDHLKHVIQSCLSRGKVDVYISLEQNNSKRTTLQLDKELALAYYNSIKELAELCNIPAELSGEVIANYPGVLSLEKADDDLTEIGELTKAALNSAIEELVSMREHEGANLAEDLLAHVTALEELERKISIEAPLIVTEYRAKLQVRIEELLDTVVVDESKLANEIAFFADKADITEELARLGSHLSQFRGVLKEDEAVGRKLEFILQEMNREINTIGSKSNSFSIGKLVIEAKSELEKIREQVQNIE
jgi:uncharacterized protein (TIGR00255 family)